MIDYRKSIIVDLTKGNLFINNEISKDQFHNNTWVSDESIYADGSIEFGFLSRISIGSKKPCKISRRVNSRPARSGNQLLLTHKLGFELRKLINGKQLCISANFMDARIDFNQEIYEDSMTSILSTEDYLLFQFDVRINQENASIIRASDGGCGNVRVMHRDEFMQYRKNLQSYRKKLKVI